jgi:uncharacterized membrane protein
VDLHPFRHKNPGVGGEKLKFDARDIALTAVFAALYAVLVLVLAGISFQLVQVRIADALIPLSMVLGWPVVIGVTVGSAVANVASPMPSVLTDVTLGSLANFVASILAWKIGLWKLGKSASEFLGCVMATVAITFIVGTYLAILTGMELWIWWLGIGIGSVISISILGYTLVQIVKRLLAKQSVT